MKASTIGPLEGMQSKSMASSARIVIMGGLRGPGKSYALFLNPLMFYARRIPTACMIFRRRYMDIHGKGGMYPKAREIYWPLNPNITLSPSVNFTWKMARGKELSVTIAAIPKEEDTDRHQGHEYGYIGIDELDQFTAMQFSDLCACLRTDPGSEFEPFLRATVNPVYAGWVRELVDWWIDDGGMPIPSRCGTIRHMCRGPDDWHKDFEVGTKEELRELFPGIKDRDMMSITFLKGERKENPHIDWEAYDGMLSMLPKWKQAQWRDGNWNVGPKDPGKIWHLPAPALFEDEDADFQAVLNSGAPLDLYGGWDYGRRSKALCWICGLLEPGAPPVLWIIGMKLWTDTSAAQAARDRASFLETLDLDFQVGRVLDAGDPSGWARDSGEGWARTLAAAGVPLVDIQHMITPDGASATYWNSAEGFTLRTDLVQAWLEQGRLRIRQHPNLRPLITAAREWRYDIPEGVDPIKVNRAQLGPDKGEHSHPGDAWTYLCAFVQAVIRGRMDPRPRKTKSSPAVNAARMARSRRLGVP